mgnify:CR=1 FL=1
MLILVFGVSLSRAQDPIKVDLHARWCSDLTLSSPQWQCVDGGTGGGEVEFHFVANYQAGPIMQVNCLKIEIEEQTDAHPPDVRVLELAFSQTVPPSNYPPPNISNMCSNPPNGGYNAYYICASKKEQTLSCHNTAYKVRATYQYVKAGLPPRTIGPLTIEKTFTFNNLTVNAEPNLLKWDPDNSSICDTTIDYSLSSAQKKNCQVAINIYNTEGYFVYATSLTELCPGSYSFTWDGKDSSGNTVPIGLYTFDIFVIGKREDGSLIPGDCDRMRSSYLTIRNHDVQELEPEDSPEEIENLNDIYDYRFTYLLCDSKDAAHAWIEIYDPNLQKIGDVSDGVAKCPTLNQVDKSVEIKEPGTYYFVFRAIDNHLETDKAHRQMPALEVNKEKSRPPAVDYDNISDGEKTKRIDLTGAWFQKKAGYLAKAKGKGSCKSIIDDLPRNRIFFIYAHGSEGGGGISGTDGWIPAKSVEGYPYSIEKLDLHYLNLAVYAGCFTADTDPTYGCIAAETVNRGAKAAVGFHGPGPSWDYNAHWKWAFWFWQAMENGYTVEGALEYAKRKVYNWATFDREMRPITYNWPEKPRFFYTDNNEVFGNKALRIVPPPDN